MYLTALCISHRLCAAIARDFAPSVVKIFYRTGPVSIMQTGPTRFRITGLGGVFG
jgi:hypothetical protein